MALHNSHSRTVALPLIVFVLAACNSAPHGDAATPPTAKQTVKKAVQPVAKSPAVAAADSPPKFERPPVVKGIYLTAWSAGSANKLAKMIKFIHNTELNSVVIDVRDSGDMYFPTHIPLSDQVQGKKNLAVANPPKLMKTLAAEHVWPIARIACFRDNYVPLKHPEQAVQTPSGAPWHDRSNHYWLDPYDKRNWEYIGATVDYALSIGFPEIQLDYVRFPSEGKSSTQVFPNAKKYTDKPNTHQDVIAAFAAYIQKKVKAHNAYYSSDIFGIISSSKSDQGIGQELEKVAAPFDVISPMIYPSHFAKGEYGIPNPNAAPYAIIVKSLHDYRKRLPTKIVRPWLQDFSLFGVHYGEPQVRAQIKALNDEGYKEFLLWNAGNKYTPNGPRSKAEAAAAEAKIHEPMSSPAVEDAHTGKAAIPGEVPGRGAKPAPDAASVTPLKKAPAAKASLAAPKSAPNTPPATG